MSGKFKNPGEGFTYLESFTNLEKNPKGATREYRLDRMEFLTERFSRPQDSCRIIHLAGSKGKGSTAMFIAAGLEKRGYKTGLYTSPHVTSYKERITLAGKELPDDIFTDELERIRTFVEELDRQDLPGGGSPTTFELLTLLAFNIFRRSGCTWAVLETGLGGRLDATNVITPEASVITTIELEHTEFLGDTISRIAGEKGGIIKKGCPVFAGNLIPEAMDVISGTAENNECPLYIMGNELDVKTEKSDMDSTCMETRINWKDGTTSTWELSMRGAHQGENAALAALTLKRLFSHRGGYPEELLKSVFEKVTMPGRMESFNYKGAKWILDGAHTPRSLALTVKTFTELYGREGILIFGSVEGKPIEPLAGETVGLFSDIIITRAGSFKPENPEKVYQIFRNVEAAEKHIEKCRIELISDPAEAFTATAEYTRGKRPVLVTGSFYLAGEIRPFLNRKQGECNAV